MRWKHWSWLGGSVLPLLLILIRFAWLWPWQRLLSGFLAPSYGGDLLPAWLVVALPLTAYLLATGVAVRQPTTTVSRQPIADSSSVAVSWRARLLVAGSGLLLIVLTLWWHYYRTTLPLVDPAWLYSLGDTLIHWGTQEVPPQVATIILLVYLWLVGMGDAVRQMSHDDVWGAMARGVVALVIYLLIMYMAGRALNPELFYLVVLLFGAGMVALALSSLKITLGLDRALGLGQRRNASGPVVNRYWLSSVLFTVFGLLGIGLLVVALIAPEQLAVLLDAAGVVLGWIGELISFILVAVSYVLFVIAYFFARLLEPLFRRLLERFQELPPLELAQPAQEAEQLQQAAEQAATVPDTYRWIGLAVIVLLLLIIFALALRRLRATTATDEDELRESILSADLLQQQLRDLWSRWFGRGRQATDPFLSLAEESEGRRRIRALYQQLLRNEATLGVARTPAETPQEYATHLLATQPTQAAALSTLTAGYHQARYAPDGPSAEQVTAAEAAWRALEAALRPEEKQQDE